MEIQWDMILFFNTVCISLSTFYLLFKFRRDFIKLKEDIEEIRLMMSLHLEPNIIVMKTLEFETGDGNDL